MTWADIAQRPAQLPPQPPPLDLQAAGSTAVLDASAIIGGFSREVAEHLVTVPAALEECRDALAQQRLQLLPEGIRVQQPCAESVKRGVSGIVLYCFSSGLRSTGA